MVVGGVGLRSEAVRMGDAAGGGHAQHLRVGVAEKYGALHVPKVHLIPQLILKINQLFKT